MRPGPWALTFAAGAYLFFSLLHLGLPGLQYDEVLFANAALGNLDGSFIHWELDVKGVKVPLMLMDYVGSLKAWLFAPIFALFGASEVSVRLPMVAIGLTTLLLTFAVMRRALGEPVAAICVLLLGFDPAFGFVNRVDWGPAAIGMALKMASLFLICRWAECGRSVHLAAAGFLMGLGLFDKVTFAWFVAALAGAAVCCYPRRLRRLLSPALALQLLLSLLLGCLPLLAFNVAYPLRTFEGQAILSQPGSWLESLPRRGRLFERTVDGSAIQDMIHQPAPGELADILARRTPGWTDRHLGWLLRAAPLERSYMWIGLLLSLGTVILLLLLGRVDQPRRVLFALLLLLLSAGLVLITPQATGPHHVVALFPFSHALVAIAVWNIARAAWAPRWLGRAIPQGLAATLAGMLIWSECVASTGCLKSLEVLGGRGNWSDAIYRVGTFVAGRPDRHFLLMDWGFNMQLLVLSNGAISKKEMFPEIAGAVGEDGKAAALAAYLINPRNIFLLHMPEFETVHVLKDFQDILRRRAIDVRAIETFFQRDGRPHTVACETAHPEVERHLQRGLGFYIREAESWDGRSGGGREAMRGASCAEALGLAWGQYADEFAEYRFALPRAMTDARLCVRYALGSPGPSRLRLTLDGLPLGELSLAPTGGWGHRPDEWRMTALKTPSFPAGKHMLRITPAADHQVVCLDLFYLSEGELQLRTDFSSATARAGTAAQN